MVILYLSAIKLNIKNGDRVCGCIKENVGSGAWSPAGDAVWRGFQGTIRKYVTGDSMPLAVFHMLYLLQACQLKIWSACPCHPACSLLLWHLHHDGPHLYTPTILTQLLLPSTELQESPFLSPLRCSQKALNSFALETIFSPAQHSTQLAHAFLSILLAPQPHCVSFCPSKCLPQTWLPDKPHSSMPRLLSGRYSPKLFPPS